MADKIVIEVFKEKTAEDFTKAISSPDCRANAGSAAAYAAAMACGSFIPSIFFLTDNDRGDNAVIPDTLNQ